MHSFKKLFEICAEYIGKNFNKHNNIEGLPDLILSHLTRYLSPYNLLQQDHLFCHSAGIEEVWYGHLLHLQMILPFEFKIHDKKNLLSQYGFKEAFASEIFEALYRKHEDCKRLKYGVLETVIFYSLNQKFELYSKTKLLCPTLLSFLPKFEQVLEGFAKFTKYLILSKSKSDWLLKNENEYIFTCLKNQLEFTIVELKQENEMMKILKILGIFKKFKNFKRISIKIKNLDINDSKRTKSQLAAFTALIKFLSIEYWESAKMEMQCNSCNDNTFLSDNSTNLMDFALTDGKENASLICINCNLMLPLKGIPNFSIITVQDISHNFVFHSKQKANNFIFHTITSF